MREGGKREKNEETERDKVALTALSCLHLERVKCTQRVSGCVWVSMCVRTSDVFVRVLLNN